MHRVQRATITTAKEIIFDCLELLILFITEDSLHYKHTNMADSPAAGAEESKEPETPMAQGGGGDDPLPESSPWLRAKSVAESMNLEAVMEDMERRYYELLQERDTLQEKVKSMTEEKESLVASQATMTTMEQEKVTLQSKIQQEAIKTKGLEEEKTLLQERMDRMQIEADQLREELGYVLLTGINDDRLAVIKSIITHHTRELT